MRRRRGKRSSAGRLLEAGAAGGRVRAVVLLAAAGALAGLAYNALVPRGVFAPAAGRDARPPRADPAELRPTPPSSTPAAPSGGSEPTLRVVGLTEAKALFAGRTALFVDARSPQRFALGHVPGALNLPSTDVEAAYPGVRGRLAAGASLVVYCESADCDESDLVVAALRARGHRRLLHFKAGWTEWENAGLPREEGAR